MANEFLTKKAFIESLPAGTTYTKARSLMPGYLDNGNLLLRTFQRYRKRSVATTKAPVHVWHQRARRDRAPSRGAKLAGNHKLYLTSSDPVEVALLKVIANIGVKRARELVDAVEALKSEF